MTENNSNENPIDQGLEEALNEAAMSLREEAEGEREGSGFVPYTSPFSPPLYNSVSSPLIRTTSRRVAREGVRPAPIVFERNEGSSLSSPSSSPSIPLTDRNARQMDRVDLEILQTKQFVIIGCGSIGRQVALILASMGVQSLILCDGDKVEAENLATQGWSVGSIGVGKAAALRNECIDRNAQSSISLVPEMITPEIDVFEEIFKDCIVFMCVDNISSREGIFKAIKGRFLLWVDGRMSAQVCRVLSSNGSKEEDEWYESTLFPPEEQETPPCTDKGTGFCAWIAAGLMVNAFSHWMRERMNKSHLRKVDLLLNLYSGDIAINKDAEGC